MDTRGNTRLRHSAQLPLFSADRGAWRCGSHQHGHHGGWVLIEGAPPDPARRTARWHYGLRAGTPATPRAVTSARSAGIYHDHLSRSGITAAERSEVIRLYQAGDKAGLFKLWQAWQREGR